MMLILYYLLSLVCLAVYTESLVSIQSWSLHPTGINSQPVDAATELGHTNTSDCATKLKIRSLYVTCHAAISIPAGMDVVG